MKRNPDDAILPSYGTAEWFRERFTVQCILAQEKGFKFDDLHKMLDEAWGAAVGAVLTRKVRDCGDMK